uniref:vacuolar protein sorting-associated protein 37-like n=1 Tax=Osmia lignaria TaxID=473952 RepID=UPI0014787641|nr:vacuolar protein sorting-associated protein 37-like [Osmia lignaria]
MQQQQMLQMQQLLQKIEQAQYIPPPVPQQQPQIQPAVYTPPPVPQQQPQKQPAGHTPYQPYVSQMNELYEPEVQNNKKAAHSSI